MTHLSPETLSLITAGAIIIMLVTGMAGAIFIIRSLRWRRIALKWAETAIDIQETLIGDHIGRSELDKLEKEYETDFNN